MSIKQAAAANASKRAKRVTEIKAAVTIKPAAPFADPRVVFPFEDVEFQRRFEIQYKKLDP